MNWNLQTATGREKLIIQYRKLSALYQMELDFFPYKPYSSFKYLANDCTLVSEQMTHPLNGISAVKDFLIQEKMSYDGLVPTPDCTHAESEDGDILLRIRPWKADEGELVQLELNEEGLICRIDRFNEKRIRCRPFDPSITLTPATEAWEGGKSCIKDIDNECIFISDLYEDEIKLLLCLQGDIFTNMEDRYMDTEEWTTLAENWRIINETENPDGFCKALLMSQERYAQGNPGYVKEMDELIRTVLEKRDPCGRRMQTMFEDWLNANKGRYELIRKC